MWRKKLYPFCHCADICSNVKCVGNKEKHCTTIHDPARIIDTDISSQSPTCCKTDSCTHLLDNCHKRKGEKCKPKKLETCLSTLLRISCNSGGVIICCSGN